ncbi:MAG: hypothetical protein HLUCCA08_09680 [Rhodobacteraceae bacterium HLUCCA08]|nr:MAG: hypothetical protein HLUCCA08_09680 [Rhodobacteraceae bacterium HLUCCA08]
MRYSDLSGFLKQGKPLLARGPVALVFVEDAIEVDSTLRHHLDAGFRAIIALVPTHIDIAADVSDQIHRVDYDTLGEGAVAGALNAVMGAAGDIWLFYCFNAEYLFYPFCEHRSVGEMLAFHTEERRNAMLTYVVDLYADDLWTYPEAVSLEDAHLDRSGYYALARKDKWNNDIDRQLDFFGGLRWRFEEHIPKPRRRIDRIGLFRNRPGLQFRPDHTFSDPEYNTYSCPWHHSLTAAICSFRTAKALKRNPGSTFEIDTFMWHNSAPFTWHSQQLLDLGLMEPGQWF